MSFDEKLRNLMQRDGVTNYKLAKNVGCSQSTVKNWLDGKAPVSDYLSKIASYFDVSVDYLLGNTDQKEEPATENGSGRDVLDEIDVAFYDGYKELSEDDKQTLRDMVDVMRARRAAKNQGK